MDHGIPPTKIGFLGTGLMGSPIACHIARAGYATTVWNRSQAKTAHAVAAGAQVVANPAAAVTNADIVCLCLTDQAAVEDVLFGAGQVSTRLRAGAVVVDLSTIGPAPTRDFAARLANVSGARWIDAPLTGGVAGAQAGTLIALVGGETAQVEELAPLFAQFTSRVSHMGGLGTGQAAKLCNQLIVSVNILAIAEALKLAGAQGIDPTCLPDALAGGWADSLPLQIIGKRMAAHQTEPKIVDVGTIAKDIAAVLAQTSGPDLPLTRAAAKIYAGALDAGLSMSDVTALGQLILENGLP